MTTNKEKFQSLISKEKSNAVSKNRSRIKNRARLRESQNIALKVLNKLNDLGWSQRRLAEELSVTPQQVNKIVKGKENLTLETQVKLQQVLDIPILASFYENKEQVFYMEDTLTLNIGMFSEYTLNYDGITTHKSQFKKSFSQNPVMEVVKYPNYKTA